MVDSPVLSFSDNGDGHFYSHIVLSSFDGLSPFFFVADATLFRYEEQTQRHLLMERKIPGNVCVHRAFISYLSKISFLYI